MQDQEPGSIENRLRQAAGLFRGCLCTLFTIACPSWLAVTGCAATPSAVTQPANAPASSQVNPMTSPFLFREARLPKGFPPPGPIGQVIVKDYPGARAAVVRSADLGKPADEGNMFRPLFNHIKRNGIAMSAPVEMSWSLPAEEGADAKPVSMAFFYGEPDIGRPGSDGSVEVLDTHPLKVLSVGVRGSYSSKHVKAGLDQLRTWLAENPGRYNVSGPPRYLGYNSPFVPWFLRYGEVQLPITDASE